MVITIKRILHECSLHIVFMKRVYYNDMTPALASVIFILVNEFHKKRYVMTKQFGVVFISY